MRSSTVLRHFNSHEKEKEVLDLSQRKERERS
jgi:hypothetical protein